MQKVNGYTTDYSYSLFKNFLSKMDQFQSLDPQKGNDKKIAQDFDDISIVEASVGFVNQLKNMLILKFTIHCLKISNQKKNMTILFQAMCQNMLLIHKNTKNIKKNLSKNGKLFCAVPNSRSHRQAAVILKILKQENQLNASDKHHGHRVTI